VVNGKRMKLCESRETRNAGEYFYVKIFTGDQVCEYIEILDSDRIVIIFRRKGVFYVPYLMICMEIIVK
jgi:hypothetical protein